MTEKWIVDDAGTLINMETRENYDYMEEVVDVLNKLSEENERLKQQNESLKDTNESLTAQLAHGIEDLMGDD